MALLYYLSRSDELPPNQFFVNIVDWGRNLAEWQRNTREVARKGANNLRYQPKITIIIPIFGSGGGRIKDTFESVNRQYYQNWELYLLVDKQPQLQLSKLTREIFVKNKKIQFGFGGKSCRCIQ